MNINRNNYETYFLLYIDNELSAAERKAVEAFIAEHTDLHEELMQLQDAVLPADDLVFDGKADLLKSEAEDKLTEKLLLHIDGELSATEAYEADKMIAANVALQTEWNILRSTKLDASEKIIFTEKHLLYRKERDNVVIGRFARWAVAAALLGFGFFAAVSIINNNKTPEAPSVATNTTPEKNNSTKIVTKETAQPLNNTEGLAEQKNSVADKQNIAKQADKIQQPIIDKNNNNSFVKSTAPVNKKEPIVATQNATNNEQPVLLVANKKNQQLEKISPERAENELAITAPKKRAEIIDKNILIPDNNSFASTASLTSEPNNDRILYMNEEDVSNSKAGSFFRKLKRTVERKTKIKTGNNLKIAGFEIALN